MYVLAKAGHGDIIVIADSNFPSDSTATSTTNKIPVRVNGSTSDVLRDILTLVSLDEYSESAVCVMDRVQSDKDKGIVVPAYERIQKVIDNETSAGTCGSVFEISYIDRYQFYDLAKKSFCIVQTTDSAPYGNVMISVGVQ